MSSIKYLTIVVLAICIGSAFSQSPSLQVDNRGQPQPHSVEQVPNPSGKSQPYPYRSSNPPTGSSNNKNNYPAATYNRDSYGTSRDSTGSPLFGVSSAADFQLSAYFGQIFWGFVAVTLTLVVSIWIIRYCAGTDVVGGLVDRIRDSSATGKSLDLDGVTNMVYEALESYGKWAVKEARHAVEINSKGRR